MVIKHFLHTRDNAGCQLLKRNVQIGTTDFKDTDNINNEQWAGKRANYGESCTGDPCQSETEMDTDRWMGVQHM